MKIQGSLFKIYSAFWDGGNRTLNQNGVFLNKKYNLHICEARPEYTWLSTQAL